MRSFLSVTCSAALLAALLPGIAAAQSTPECALFTRNLALGASGADVRALQVFLNTDARTRVSLDGAGSPGNETTYFGMKTKTAVTKFQDLYRSEVLTPVGLTSGSGFVGTFSRAKITALCTQKPSSFQISPPSVNSSPQSVPSVSPGVSLPTSSSASKTPPLELSGGFHSDTPVIIAPSSYAAPRGATISISGLGFSSIGNVVHLGPLSVSDVKNLSGELSFVVPDTAPFGPHELWVVNDRGQSNKTYFSVITQNALAPTITSISPKEGFQGTVVTISGTGFTSTGNDVHTSNSIVEDLPSRDGKTIRLPITMIFEDGLDDEDVTTQISTGYDDPSVDMRDPVAITIMNANGISNTEFYTFKI